MSSDLAGVHEEATTEEQMENDRVEWRVPFELLASASADRCRKMRRSIVPRRNLVS